MTDTDTHLSFVHPAVHIATDGKVHTAALVHPNHADVVFSVILPCVGWILGAKPINPSQRVGPGAVVPQLPRLHKTDFRAAFVGPKIHVRRADSQEQILRWSLPVVSGKDFLHRALKIEQVQPFNAAAHAIVFFHVVIRNVVFLVREGEDIPHENHIEGITDLLNTDDRLCHLRPVKISPADL